MDDPVIIFYMVNAAEVEVLLELHSHFSMRYISNFDNMI